MQNKNVLLVMRPGSDTVGFSDFALDRGDPGTIHRELDIAGFSIMEVNDIEELKSLYEQQLDVIGLSAVIFFGRFAGRPENGKRRRSEIERAVREVKKLEDKIPVLYLHAFLDNDSPVEGATEVAYYMGESDIVDALKTKT